MKIVYVITRSDVIGGASVHLLDLAHGAQDAGHEVVILVGGHGVFLDRAKEKGLRCVSLRYMVREISLLKDLRGLFELRRTIVEIKPDIIHLHSSKAGILGRLVAKSLSVPVVFTAHGWAFTEGVSERRRAMYRFMERIMARFASKVITVSEYDKRLALDLGVGNQELITTIHNGMPDCAVCEKDYIAGDATRMVMVARFDSPKNHLALIEALTCIKHLKWSLEFVGDGPLLKSVHDVVRRYDLNDQVVFSGACNDVSARLAKADIFILTSNWEGLPLTILEAMRAGLPVVASRVGGVPESIEQGRTGFLIERNDQQSLVEALTDLIESAELREAMGRQGRRKFENEFTFEVMLRKTLDVYVSAMRGLK